MGRRRDGLTTGGGLGGRWEAGGRGGAADEGRVAGGTGTTLRAVDGGSTTDEVGNIVVGLGSMATRRAASEETGIGLVVEIGVPPLR